MLSRSKRKFLIIRRKKVIGCSVSESGYETRRLYFSEIDCLDMIIKIFIFENNLKAIHNKDYSVVKTFKVAQVAFFYSSNFSILPIAKISCRVEQRV